MKRLRDLLRHSELHGLFFCIGLVLLNWPFLGMFQLKQPGAVLVYLLVLWFFAIFFLFLISLSCAEPDSEEDRNRGKDSDA